MKAGHNLLLSQIKQHTHDYLHREPYYKAPYTSIFNATTSVSTFQVITLLV